MSVRSHPYLREWAANIEPSTRHAREVLPSSPVVRGFCAWIVIHLVALRGSEIAAWYRSLPPSPSSRGPLA
jgi:hypothetical protein